MSHWGGRERKGGEGGSESVLKVSSRRDEGEGEETDLGAGRTVHFSVGHGEL